VTDRQTDRILIARLRLHYKQHGKKVLLWTTQAHAVAVTSVSVAINRTWAHIAGQEASDEHGVAFASIHFAQLRGLLLTRVVDYIPRWCKHDSNSRAHASANQAHGRARHWATTLIKTDELPLCQTINISSQSRKQINIASFPINWTDWPAYLKTCTVLPVSYQN